MILADDEQEREAALAKLLPMQRGDFEAIFKTMAGLPVTIRLLDPPLHEFLPHKEEEIEEVAKASGVSVRKNCARGQRAARIQSRCWAIAAAGWASPIPKSTKCRPAPSSRPPPMWRRRAASPCSWKS